MAGGLINIVSYAANDIYLTGSPEITFYKMAYRRYTNFAIESVFLDFDDDIKFNYESELTPPRIGDLLHKSYLHINIPCMNITKQDVGIDADNFESICEELNIPIHNNENMIDKSVQNYEKIKNVYMHIMTNIYRIIFKAVNAQNVTYTTLIQDVHDYVNNDNYNGISILDILKSYNNLLETTKKTHTNVHNNILDYTKSNLWHILTNIDYIKLYNHVKKIINENHGNESVELNGPNNDYSEYIEEIQRIMKLNTLKEIQKGLEMCKNVQQYYFDKYRDFIEQSTNNKCQNIKFAWVKNLGHSIIEYIDVYIGGKRIDRHLGIWINIWYQLTYKEAQIDIYNKLIGNVDILTNFDHIEKPSYDMYIPLTFWFSKFNGLSFPLIAMQYNDISFKVKLRKIEEVFFIERLYKGVLNGNEIILTAQMIKHVQDKIGINNSDLMLINIEEVDDIVLSDIWNDKGKSIHGHILLDYVFLETPERKRFAQSGHEYLIERIQYEHVDNVKSSEFDIQLDYFTNPCKELIWVFIKNIYTQNEKGWNECKWHDYSTYGLGDKSAIVRPNWLNKNPVLSAALNFNNHERVQRQIGKYFDTYQPFIFHKISPSPGINIYSFCLDPLQHQPTGSCNFSVLCDVRLFVTLDDMFLRYTDANIYPHDLHINFNINILDPSALLESIDIKYARRLIKLKEEILENANDNIFDNKNINIPNYVLSEQISNAEHTVKIYDMLLIGNTILVPINSYRKLILKTTGSFYAFNLSMNILRLIGGYGDLAYSGST
jgi:hypothetical protein